MLILWSKFFITKGKEFYCVYFDLYEKFARGCPPKTPTQKLKSGFQAFSSQEIGSSLISFQMILEARQSELLKFDFHSLQKIPESNLIMIRVRSWKYLHLINFKAFSEWKPFSFCISSDFDIAWCLFDDQNFRRLVAKFWKIEKVRYWKIHHFQFGSENAILFINIFDNLITFNGNHSISIDLEWNALEFNWVTTLILRSVTVFFQNSFSAHINDQNFLLVRLSTFASNTSVPFPVSLMELLTKSKSWNRSEFREI